MGRLPPVSQYVDISSAAAQQQAHTKSSPELRGGIMHCHWHLLRHIHCQGPSCLLCRAPAFGGKIEWVLTHVAILQTHTGDYNNAGYPFHCQPIGGEEKPDLSLMPDGSLASNDPELEVETLLSSCKSIAQTCFPRRAPQEEGVLVTAVAQHL